MKIAAVNWKLRDIAKESEFYDHLRELLDKCRNCNLIVLPEMFSLELLALYPEYTDRDIPSILRRKYNILAGRTLEWLHQSNNDPRNTLIIAGSSLRTQKMGGGRITINASSGLTRNIHIGCVSGKRVLTEWEKGIGVRHYPFGLGYLSDFRVGVTICLDSEFPGSSRALAESGMLYQCVPAWTETLHGFNRVRWACQARAVENQVCVVHSSLVGHVGRESSCGSSAIIVPPHDPFPLNPILAETPMDEEGVAIAEVARDDLLRCRERGEVRNWRDRNQSWLVEPIDVSTLKDESDYFEENV